MASIYTVLAHTPNDYHSIMVWAACCTAFFGFFWCSEFTVPSLQEFDQEVHLTIINIAIDKIVEPSVVHVTIKQLIPDPFDQESTSSLVQLNTQFAPLRRYYHI